MKWRGVPIIVGKALAGEPAGLEPVGRLGFFRYPVRSFDERQGVVRKLKNPNEEGAKDACGSTEV